MKALFAGFECEATEPSSGLECEASDDEETWIITNAMAGGVVQSFAYSLCCLRDVSVVASGGKTCRMPLGRASTCRQQIVGQVSSVGGQLLSSSHTV